MGVPVRDFLKRRRDRAVGSILGYAEREIFKDLSIEQREGLRRVVLDEDGIRNDYLVELLERIDKRLPRQAS
jgi:hypothetical protein